MKKASVERQWVSHKCFTSSCFRNCLSKRSAESVHSFENASSLRTRKHNLTALCSEIVHYKTILASLVVRYVPFHLQLSVQHNNCYLTVSVEFQATIV